MAILKYYFIVLLRAIQFVTVILIFITQEKEEEEFRYD